MSVLTFLLFKLNPLQKNCQTLNQLKPWCDDSGYLVEFTTWSLHHANNVKEVVSSRPSITWYKPANQKIGICTVYGS